MNTHNLMLEAKLEKGEIKECITLWNSPERKAFIDSISDKFGASKSNIFFRGLVALLQKEREIQANIALGSYVEAYFSPSSKRLAIAPPKWGKSVVFYVYDIYIDMRGKYTVIYKENNEYDDREFKGMTFNSKRLDADIIAQFSDLIERGIPK